MTFRMFCFLLVGFLASCNNRGSGDSESKLKSDFDTTWVVDVEASLARMTEVPSSTNSRYRSLDEYKDYVKRQVNGLQVILHSDRKVTIKGGWDSTTNATWIKDDNFEYWIYKSQFMSAGVGHGFKRTAPDEAELKFQIEWTENSATREYLVMRPLKN
jgi:hypothetical protein